jgi:hypothetical protein
MNDGIASQAELLKAFIKGLRDFMPRGGSRILAETIGMKESAFSRFMKDDLRNFDEATLISLALMRESRSESLPEANMTASGEFGPFVFKEWRKMDGELAYTWSPKE